MCVLGVDPGYDRIGIAIISGTKGAEQHIYSDCITTNPKDSFEDRLFALGTRLAALIAEYQPTVLAIENTFFNTNKTTAIKVSEARGVILYEARRADLEIFEYSPPQIKLAITGHGHADKTQITTMIGHLITIPEKLDRLDDEYDAIAVALTHNAIQK